MHQLLAYIKFLWKSTNEHGVHSPFVFELLTKCLYKKEQSPNYTRVLEYRNALLNDHREIEVTDFGAGSRVFKSNKRKNSAIAKNAGISKKRAVLLNKLIPYLQIKSALELGTSVGISSAAIATGNKVKLVTIEGCPQTAAVAREYFEKFGLQNIQLEVGNFEEILSGRENRDKNQESGTKRQETGLENREQRTERREKNQESRNKRQESRTKNKEQREEIREMNTLSRTDFPLSTLHSPLFSTDLIYFDGNHQKAATLKYFHQLLPLAHNDSVFIFDDIHWSKGMEEAWEEIKAHPSVRVSIDSFFWGMVFFRQEQAKEHFTIRL